MTFKLAIGNVRASLRDFAVYFATLACAACLLYAFTASTDYLAALDLTDAQRESIASAGGILQGFSVFSVVVFAFLIAYANRFLVRRRKREFAVYALLGMDAGAVGRVLLIEGAIVGAASLACGIAVGAAASPAFGLVAAFVFGAPWAPAFAFAPGAAVWTAGCFVAIMIIATAFSARDVRRRPLIDLLNADRTPERMRGSGRIGARAQAVAAAALLAVVWGSCVFAPGIFITLIIPMGFAAVFATYFVFHLAARRVERQVKRNPDRFLVGLRPFTAGRVFAKAESNCMALSCACVLVAAAVCMICAGFAFSVGVRANGEITLLAQNLAPIGYVGIFYGATFLVAAAAVLSLRQLSDAADARREYAFLEQIGAPEEDMRASVRAQVAVAFAAPVAFALVHDVFGLVLVALLAYAVGSAGFGMTAFATIAVTVAILGAYGIATARSCERALVGQ